MKGNRVLLDSRLILIFSCRVQADWLLHNREMTALGHIYFDDLSFCLILHFFHISSNTISFSFTIKALITFTIARD